jgi:signal-transduction protein with cAMP-binding, CBS, and nucleotidyltransferase domain
MRVEEVCSRRIFHVPASCSLQEAARQMRDRRIGALFVTERTSAGLRVDGVVTERDLVVHGLASAADCGSKPVATVMTQGLVTVDGAAAVSDALRAMLAHGVRRLAVLDGHRTVFGVVSMDDAVRAVAADWTLLAGILQREREQESPDGSREPLFL